MATDPLARFPIKLREQLGFISRSCQAYDQGHEDEALRMATAMRVLFHTTPKSTSLLSHLGLLHATMLSSARGHDDWHHYLKESFDFSSATPVKMLPILGNQFQRRTLSSWWADETVFRYNKQKFFRKTIILSAANKDGGAHVDKELEEYYEVLCAGEYFMGLTGNFNYVGGPPPFQQGVTQYPKNGHLALIRQFAHECLASATGFLIDKQDGPKQG